MRFSATKRKALQAGNYLNILILPGIGSIFLNGKKLVNLI